MNQLSSFTHLFWDLDGTLTESAPGIMNSARHALEYYGIRDVPESTLKKFIGPPLLNLRAAQTLKKAEAKKRWSSNM